MDKRKAYVSSLGTRIPLKIQQQEAKATRRRSATTRTPISDATNRPTNQHNKHNRSRASSCSTVHVRAPKMRQMPIFFAFFSPVPHRPKMHQTRKVYASQERFSPKTPVPSTPTKSQPQVGDDGTPQKMSTWDPHLPLLKGSRIYRFFTGFTEKHRKTARCAETDPVSYNCK